MHNAFTSIIATIVLLRAPALASALDGLGRGARVGSGLGAIVGVDVREDVVARVDLDRLAGPRSVVAHQWLASSPAPARTKPRSRA